VIPLSLFAAINWIPPALSKGVVSYGSNTKFPTHSADYYEFFHGGKLVARHHKAARHSVVMEPAHYAGLLRAATPAALPAPPCFDPNFGQLGEVMVRDLALYEAASRGDGGEVQ
jgi:hypothetical protein